MDEEQQFNQAFGEHTGIYNEDINDIKNNDPNTTEFTLDVDDAGQFTNLAWKLLGRYIANNTHLKKFDLEDCILTDEKMALLFSELVGSESLQRLDLDGNTFGIDGVRSMTPFLQNCPHISILYFCGNHEIDSECFELLLSTLSGKSVRELYFYNCNITNTTALETYNLPNLQTLNLSNNKIGSEGCIVLSNILQKEGSHLIKLHLESTGTENDGAKIIAASLKHNTSLKELYLSGNNITNEAYSAFLKILIDISSVESTYNSNHTLRFCSLTGKIYHNEIQTKLSSACGDNTRSSNPKAAGRTKFIKYQLNSQNRKRLCELQDIEYIPGSVFADIEPTLLPQILALIGSSHGQSELYTALIHTAPDLLSYIDRKAMLDEAMAKITSRATSLSEEYEQKVAEYEKIMASLKTQFLSETSRLTAEKNDLKNRRTLIDVGDNRRSATGEGEWCGGSSRGKKRGRS